MSSNMFTVEVLNKSGDVIATQGVSPQMYECLQQDPGFLLGLMEQCTDVSGVRAYHTDFSPGEPWQSAKQLATPHTQDAAPALEVVPIMDSPEQLGAVA